MQLVYNNGKVSNDVVKYFVAKEIVMAANFIICNTILVLLDKLHF